MFILQYIVVTLTIIYLVVYATIKIKYPFWNNQPVYHTYDFWRAWWSEPFFIYKYRPIKTKFYNPFCVQTLPYLETTSDQKSQVLDLLRSNYISNDRILLTLQEKDLDAACAGHLDTPYISFYVDKKFKRIAPKVLESLENQDNISGLILSNSINIYVQSSPQDKTYSEIPMYFMDFLCVHRELDPSKKTRMIRELFQTHEFKQRLYQPAVLGSLFKREIDLLEGIVPLVQYTSYVYYLRDLGFRALPPHFHVVQITAETMDLFADFMFVQTHLDLEKSNHLTLLSMTNLGNYVETIKQNTTYVFCLKRGEHVYAIYFFKDAKMCYEDLEGDTLQCYGSFCNTESLSVFYLGFLHALHQIVKKYPNFKLMMWENLGDSVLLHQKWREKNTPIFENKAAYYTFNWVHPGSPLQPEKCLFL